MSGNSLSPVPDNEQQRLAHLWNLNILDTPIEERFERLTRVLRRTFSVPIAAVTLIDRDRQWCKSIQGESWVELPRCHSFCAHTILTENSLVVSAADSDPRFSANRLVTHHGIRSYAGHPLTIVPGIRVGALCVLDRQARDFGKDDLEFLQDLAVTTSNALKTSLVRNLLATEHL